jgi:hypothetical protein
MFFVALNPLSSRIAINHVFSKHIVPIEKDDVDRAERLLFLFSCLDQTNRDLFAHSLKGFRNFRRNFMSVEQMNERLKKEDSSPSADNGNINRAKFLVALKTVCGESLIAKLVYPRGSLALTIGISIFFILRSRNMLPGHGCRAVAEFGSIVQGTVQDF